MVYRQVKHGLYTNGTNKKKKCIRHNFVKTWPWNLRKMQGKWRNGESSVLSNFPFNCKHQIFIHHRRSAAPRIVMHIFVSIKQSRPSPYHWTTNGTFFIQVTKLTMILSRFHVLHIQETDYIPHFTYRISHTAGFSVFLNIINTQHDVETLFECLQTASVPCHRINNLGTHAHHHDRGAAVAILANRTYFLENPCI